MPHYHGAMSLGREDFLDSICYIANRVVALLKGATTVVMLKPETPLGIFAVHTVSFLFKFSGLKNLVK